MAIYHLSVKPVGRGGGRSATAAAAYRAAELVHDHTTGQTFDYTRKRGVEHTEIVLPTEAAKRDINWPRDREALWNAAEVAERRKDSRLAREYEIALPHELTKGQRLELVRGFALEIANRHGVAVDFAIHAPHREGDERNHHAHLLATTRVIEPGGLGRKVDIELGDRDRGKKGLGPAKEEILAIRARWADLQNEKFRELGLPFRVDHRTLEAQGIEREPTVHLGPAVSSLERRGIETEVGKRLEREALEAAQRRLERAAELGKVAREGRELSASIIDVSGNLAAAKREREREIAKAVEPPPERAPARSLDELQKEGRERWLAMRAEEREREKAPERAAEPSIEKRQDPARSIDEERQQAIERWREYRQNLEQSGPKQSREREGPEPGLDRDRERDGPDLDL